LVNINAARKTWPVALLLVAALVVTVSASLGVKQGIEQDARKQFAFECDQVTLKIQERLGAYALILRGGAGLFGTTGTVARNAWRAYVQTLDAVKSVPGVQGIGFAKVISPDQLAAHIDQLHREGFTQYTVRPPGERALYTSIIYIEPFRDRNLRAFGYDMFSEPVRRAAMEHARDTGEATLSGKVELVQETGKEVQAGTLMYVPVYRNGAEVGTVEQRRAALIGWVYSPYRMNDLMGGILANWMSQQGKLVDLHIYDGAVASPAALLFDSKPSKSPQVQSLFYQTRTIDFNGRPWRLGFYQAEAVSGISYAPAWTVLLGGTAVSVLLAALLLSVITTRSSAKRMAANLTEEVRLHVEQIDAIFALSPDGFVTLDAVRRIRFVSPAFSGMTGLDAEDLIGMDEDSFYRLLKRLCAGEADSQSIATLRANAQPNAVASADAVRDQTIELAGEVNRVLKVSLRIPRTQAVSLILYFRDITHETEVDRLKSEFLAHAAHELRTPMASIHGFTELLLSREFDEAERRDFLETIFRQSHVMVSIINELLDLARIEARGGKDFTLGALDLEVLLQQLIEGFKTPKGRAPLQRVASGRSLWVHADRSKLTQAISNVISNAYKYSPRGGDVHIDLPQDAAAGRIGIRVVDHGMGMSSAQLARVCERFYRADASGNIPGTGLGMSIVKEIVELHGGQLDIASTLGNGTTVTIWLPTTAPGSA